MNRNGSFRSLTVSLVLVGVFVVNSLMADSGTWNGTDNASWTNSANWSSSSYPGSATGETATFNSAGNGNVLLDLVGLNSIYGVIFDSSAAAYTLGLTQGGDEVVLEDSGEVQLTSSAANSQTVNANIRLGTTTSTASYTIRNDNSAQDLTVNGVFGRESSTKTVNVNGSGDVAVRGGFNASSGTLNVYKNSTGDLSIGGNSHLRQFQVNGTGTINLEAGTVMTFWNNGSINLGSAVDCTINGPGKIALSTSDGEDYSDNGVANGKTMTINATLTANGTVGFEYWHSTYRGTVEMLGDNDFTGEVIFNVPGIISVTNVNNKGVSGNLGAGNAVYFKDGSNGRLRLTGPGTTTDREIRMRNNGIIEMAGTGNLEFTTPVNVTDGSRTLTLDGDTAGTGEFSGELGNGGGTLAIVKEGTGSWIFSADNTYSGSTTLNEGTLKLSGTGGAITDCANISVASGATLTLDNTSSGSNSDRLRDSGTLNVNGGTLYLANDDGAFSVSEIIGTLNLVSGANTIEIDQAASGQTSTLTISSISKGGTVNFVGTGLGDANGRNRILITGQPDGLIGPWATVNGTAFAVYDSTLGVYASATVPTGIAARGPLSVIPDDASAEVIINSAGTSGPITLEGDWTNTTFLLEQDFTTNAVVQTVNGSTSKTFQVSAVVINSGKAGLAIGENENDGIVMAQSNGGDVLLKNNSTAELTVNAAVVDNGAASSLLVQGSGTSRLTGANTYSGPTVINEGELVIDSLHNQSLSGSISGTGSFSKDGTNTLVISGANSYEGVTTISDGIVYAENNSAFGATSSGTTIEPGATLEVGGTIAENSFNLGSEMITVSGTGYNGAGAIINDVGGTQYSAIRQMTLAGDVTLSSNVRWDMRNSGGAANLYMNGYDITKIGGNYFILVATEVDPGAGNIDIQEGSFGPETSARMNGDSNNVMTVRSGATFDFYHHYGQPVAWSMYMEDGARFNSRAGDAPDRNNWNGPVTLAGTSIMAGSAGSSYRFNGQISGSGGIEKQGDATVYLNHTNNTYTGNTVVNGGVLYADNAGALPDYSKVTVEEYDTLAVKTGDGTNGWDLAQIQSLHDEATFNDMDAFLRFDLQGGDFTYDNIITEPMGISQDAGGVLTVTGSAPLRSAFRMYGGELVFDSVDNYVTNNSCYIGYSSGNSATVTVKGTAALTANEDRTLGTQNLIVGNSGNGVLKIQDNAVITNKLIAGYNTSGAGAVYQSGGIFDNLGGAANDGRIGLYGYGYYELSDGYYKQRGYSQLAYGTASIGILRVDGGTFEQSNQFSGNLGISRGGTGVLHQVGGYFTTPATLEIGDDSNNYTTGGFAEYTIEGGTGTITSDILMANRTNMFATLNLNGGMVSANRIYKSSYRTGAEAYVNFDGGIFQDRNGGTVIESGSSAPDAVNIYDGGAVIDSQGNNCSMPVSLLAPEGNGVDSISVTPTGGYIGPPMVTISGGGGYGATASADFDSASGTVTGITITSPGFGYITAPSVTLSGGGASTQAEVTGVYLSANTSGGLTKIGTGSLVLGATNTYAGTTVISNGVLTLGLAEAMPSGTDVSVDGGIYDLGGNTVTNGAVAVTSGSIINGTLVSDSLTKNDSGEFTLIASLETADPLVINGGVVRLVGQQVGLYEGSVSGSFETDLPNPATEVELGTLMADNYSTDENNGGWPDNTTFIYTGYIWNRATTNVTWTFAENFDDNVKLVIDTTTVIENGNNWMTPVKGTITLSPGPHSFEARFGQGGGGAGPVDGRYTTPTSWWETRDYGFGIDSQGRDSEVVGNYVPLRDPGDGSLLTTTAGSATNLLSPDTVVQMAAGSTLDLGGVDQTLDTLSGSGTVSNGTLTVTDTLAPGGVDTIGTLSISASLNVNAEVLVDVTTGGSSDLLEVAGDLDLSGAILTVANPGSLNTALQYTIIDCNGAITQPFASVDTAGARWKVAYKPDGTAKLIYQSGAVLILR